MSPHAAPHTFERRFDVVAFDADDTLWHSEDWFQATGERFVELVAPYVPSNVDLPSALVDVERANLSLLGYGVRAFTLSMVEAAVSLSGGSIPSSVVGALVELGKAHLGEPVRLLPGAADVLADVATDHRLVLITKGDLLHQSHKVASSGLSDHFEHVEIVLEKDAAAYAAVLGRLRIDPSRFVMVGNSLRSDILPVLSIGGHGVHVPYPLLWELEHVDDDTDGADLHEHVIEVPSLADLPAWLRADR